jgi:inosose dehydratase
MSRPKMKVAVNPLPWVLSDTGYQLSRTVLGEALADLRDVGFRALHAQVPDDMSVQQYRQTLADYGFVPAPGYFSADFTDPGLGHDLRERARHAAQAHQELGLSQMFIALSMSIERLARPAVGHLADDERLKRLTDGLVAAAEVMQVEGVTAALHSLVGSWVETEDEVRAVLDWSDGSALAFGPDTGHLFWGGADPARLIQDYATRVACVHMKDVNEAAVATARRQGDDYRSATTLRHVWTEPGRGDVDLDAVITALDGFDGWAVLEVDVPNLPTRVESARAGLSYFEGNAAFDVSVS